MVQRFAVGIERDRGAGLYVGILPGLPGPHTQAASLDKLQQDMTEVLALCHEEEGTSGGLDVPEFVGSTMIEVQV